MQKFGLIFDVDGVIADTEPINARATIKMYDDLFGVKGIQPKDFEAGIGRGAEKYIEAAANVHNIKLTVEQLASAVSIRGDYIIAIFENEPLPTFAGVHELINAALARSDFGVAIATSGERKVSEAILRAAKVPYQKMVYISGDMVKHKKPDPELFLLAAKGLALAPQVCVVIEDAPDGVMAAKAAGAHCLAVTNSTAAVNLKQADLICASLSKISPDTIINLVQPRTGR